MGLSDQDMILLMYQLNNYCCVWIVCPPRQPSRWCDHRQETKKTDWQIASTHCGDPMNPPLLTISCHNWPIASVDIATAVVYAALFSGMLVGMYFDPTPFRLLWAIVAGKLPFLGFNLIVRKWFHRLCFLHRCLQVQCLSAPPIQQEHVSSLCLRPIPRHLVDAFPWFKSAFVSTKCSYSASWTT